MPYISEFRAKWDFYKPRAPQISPHFAEFRDGPQITQADVAAKIPKAAHANVPAAVDDGIAGAAFGNWLATEAVPDNRVKQWADLTNVPIDVWTSPLSTFERTVRQRLGEVVDWPWLVQTQAKRGPLRVRPRDRDPQPERAGRLRMLPDGYDPYEQPVDIKYVWQGCVADITIPSLEPRDGEDRRAWLLADYEGKRAFMLDPAKPATGEAASSRIDRRCWHSNRRDIQAEGHVVLPRSAPGYVWIPPSTRLGTRFDVIGLTLNLTQQPDDIRALFDALEQRWLVDLRQVPAEEYQKTVRATLDEAAALITGRDIGLAIFAQTCEVVDRTKAAVAP